MHNPESSGLMSPSKSPFSQSRFNHKLIESRRPSSQSNSRPPVAHRPKVDADLALTPEPEPETLIAFLRHEIKRLKAELESMRKINKALLESEKISPEDYRSFYQTVLVDRFQRKAEEMSMRRDDSQRNTIELGYMKTEVRQATQKSFFHQRKLVGTSVSSSVSELQNKTLRKRLNKINGFLLEIQQKTDILQVLNFLAVFLKAAFRVQSVSFIIINDELKSMYTKCSRSFTKHLWNNTQILLPEGPNFSSPSFESLHIEHIVSGFTTGKNLYSTILYNNAPSIYISLSSKIGCRSDSSLFTASDLDYLTLISSTTSLAFNYLCTQQRFSLEASLVSELSLLVSSLIYNKNHQELSNNIYKHLSAYLDFEAAGIVFADTARQEFFLMCSADNSTDKFAASTVRLPCHIGITGEVYKGNSVCKVDKFKSNRKYDSDVDNACRMASLRNGIYASLEGIDGEIVGVLQLANKKNLKEIEEVDLDRVRSVRRIVGICVSCTNFIIESSYLAINFQQAVQNAVVAINEVEKAKGGELSDIKNALGSLKSNLGDWISQKRQKSMTFAN